MSKVVIIGGNAGGMTAAGRAARIDPQLDITVLEQGPHVSYSICGAPYFISGDVPAAEDLVSYTPAQFFDRWGVKVFTGLRATRIETHRRRVWACETATAQERQFEYDRLLIATGYRPRRLARPGSDHGNIYSLNFVQDAEKIRRAVRSGLRRALLVGGGLVNVELAEAMTRSGLQVTLVEKKDRILQDLDPEMARLVEQALERNGVRLKTKSGVKTLFAGDDGQVDRVWLEDESDPLPADIVLVDIGVEPEVDLAEQTGIRLGRSGAVEVTENLETSIPGIFAAGNCAEAVHLVSNQPVFSALGTAANKQGRIAGENLAGRRSVFRGVLHTWVVRVFDIAVARTGLSEEEARRCGFKPVAAQITAPARARYLPGSAPLTVRVVADSVSRRLLGVQAVGLDAEKRVDVAAAAITGGLRLEDASQLDLSYSPPFSQVWDPLLIAIHAVMRQA